MIGFDLDGDTPETGRNGEVALLEVRDGEVLTAFAAGELEPEGDEPGFRPVLAYEAAAPSGGDRS